MQILSKNLEIFLTESNELPAILGLLSEYVIVRSEAPGELGGGHARCIILTVSKNMNSFFRHAAHCKTLADYKIRQLRTTTTTRLRELN